MFAADECMVLFFDHQVDEFAAVLVELADQFHNITVISLEEFHANPSLSFGVIMI
jgi:hypothetical protein